jgi:hypothetical protein
VTLSHTEVSSHIRKTSSKGYCVGLGCRVWCIHSKHRECACSQAHLCTLARMVNPRREAGAERAYGPPRASLEEVAGLSNSSGGARNLRPWEREEGAGATSHQTQSHEALVLHPSSGLFHTYAWERCGP